MKEASQLIEIIIRQGGILKDHPKKGVNFAVLDHFFDVPEIQERLARAVNQALSGTLEHIDGVAGIASRGYLFLDMIQSPNKTLGKYLIQKVKAPGDSRYQQLKTSTEYSTDQLQVLKGKIKQGQHYLVVDDLIATGGSVQGAIELIEAEGGVVDAVFSLTELVDFNARKKLEDQGIKLISVLKFSEEDLDKILALQTAYQVAADAPLTFQLSQHQSTQTFEPAAIANQDNSLEIYVGSQSLIKTSAVRESFEHLFDPFNIKLHAIDAASNVSDQPLEDETITGARHRLQYLKEHTAERKSACLVSIENGIRFDQERLCYVDFVQICLQQNEHVIEVKKDCCDIPGIIIEAMQKNSDGSYRETWGEAAVRLGMATDSKNPHQDIAHVSRQAMLYQAMLEAAGLLKSSLPLRNNTDEEKIEEKIISRTMIFDDKEQSGNAKRKVIKSRPINLYNQGCPVDKWQIAADKVQRNQLKVFQTGDPFTIISPDVQLKGANVHIHVGFEHKHFSKEVLSQEALQLCRCAREHGANSITVALPESCHPEHVQNGFNSIYTTLLEASGADQLYFYDASYTGHIQDELIQLADVPDQKIQPHIILCCSANQSFAIKMANQLRQQGELVRLYPIEGQGSEATIPTAAEIADATVSIVQSTRPNPHDFILSKAYGRDGNVTYFYEAAAIAYQAKQRGAKSINLVNPYQFSARSDKAEIDPVKGSTGAYVQQNGLLLKSLGIDQVMTAECHDAHTMSGTYTDGKRRGGAVPGLSKMTVDVAKRWLDQRSLTSDAQLRLVIPDEGAAKRTKALTQILQAVLGDKMCNRRVIGEKHRDSHQDNSAKISNLSVGDVDIRLQDKYIITDDETATGSTLCQAIETLKHKGAEDISVIVVHNNLPLDWLERQLCLTRFLFIGARDLHFSDTHEMGMLANNYHDLILQYHNLSGVPTQEIEAKVEAWFYSKVSTSKELFENFKEKVSQLQDNVEVHSLAGEFAREVRTKPYMSSAYAFNDEVGRCLEKFSGQNLVNIAVYEGASVPVAAAVAMKLNLPLTVISDPAIVALPRGPFALLGEPTDDVLNYLANTTTLSKEQLSPSLADPEMATGSVINQVFSQAEKKESRDCLFPIEMDKLNTIAEKLELQYKALKINSSYRNRTIKLLAIGLEGQILAGQLSVLLKQRGCPIGIAAVNIQDDELLVDQSVLDMGEVVIPVGSNLGEKMKADIKALADKASVFCSDIYSQPQVENKAISPLSYKNGRHQLFFKPEVAAANTQQVLEEPSLHL